MVQNTDYNALNGQ